MSEKIIQCPVCGGQKLSIHVNMSYQQYYTVEGIKLYKTSKSCLSQEGMIWINCLDCLQKENVDPRHRWPATKEQTKLLRHMIIEPRAADVTEQMNKEK